VRTFVVVRVLLGVTRCPLDRYGHLAS